MDVNMKYSASVAQSHAWVVGHIIVYRSNFANFKFTLVLLLYIPG